MTDRIRTTCSIAFSSEELLRQFTFDILQYDTWMPNSSESPTSYWERLSNLQQHYFKIICPQLEDTASSYIDNFGSKSIIFDDLDFYETEINIVFETSSTPPFGLFEKMSQHALALDSDASLLVTWEHENFEFIGAAAYNKNGDDFDEYIPSQEQLKLLTYEDPADDHSLDFYDMMSDEMNNLVDCVLYNVSFSLKQPANE